MATFYGVMAIFMWGGLALLGTTTSKIPSFQLLFICFSISATLMFIKRILTGKAPLTSSYLTSKQWLIGIIGLFGFHFCYFMALKKAPAIEVSLISYLWPMLFALFVSTKATLLSSFVGSLIGFIGVGFIIVGGVGLSYNQEYLTGYMLSACCAFIWSSYSWFQSKTNNDVDEIGWLSVAVAILSLFAHLLLEPSNWSFSFNQWVCILLLGIGPVGGAFYLWDIGLKMGNKRLLASLSYSAPLISAIALSLAGKSTWTINILISLFLILFGALVSNGKIFTLFKKQKES